MATPRSPLTPARPRELSWLLVLLALLPLLYLAGRARAEGDPTAIDAYLAGMHQRRKFNGVVLVAHQGKVTFEKAYGFARYQPRKPLAADSVFNLASVSKPFTAMAVMTLKERGALAYDDDVRKYIPGLPFQGVTIRHLLHHTAGLPDYMELAEEHWDSDQILYNKDIVALLKRHKPKVQSKPGAKYEYSNTAYALLATVVEKASSKPFGTYLRETIFAPLGMASTFVYSPAAIKPFAARRAFGYQPKGKGYELDDVGYLDGVVGDGGIYSTTADLLRWDQALYGEKLVPAAALREALTPGRLNNGSVHEYGFGWVIQDDMVWHNGSWAGFRSFITRYISSRDTVIILTNTSCEDIDTIDQRLQKLVID